MCACMRALCGCSTTTQRSTAHGWTVFSSRCRGRSTPAPTRSSATSSPSASSNSRVAGDMRFALTDEHRELARAARDMFAKESPPYVARAGDIDAVWPRIAELGVLGDPDFGMVDAAVLLEEAGRACVPGPLPETFAALAVANDEWRARIADGSALVTAAAPYAAYADRAAAIVSGESLRTDMTVTAVDSVDPARP